MDSGRIRARNPRKRRRLLELFYAQGFSLGIPFRLPGQPDLPRVSADGSPDGWRIEPFTPSLRRRKTNYGSP